MNKDNPTTPCPHGNEHVCKDCGLVQIDNPTNHIADADKMVDNPTTSLPTNMSVPPTSFSDELDFALNVLWAHLTGFWDAEGAYPDDSVLDKYDSPEKVRDAVNAALERAITPSLEQLKSQKTFAKVDTPTTAMIEVIPVTAVDDTLHSIRTGLFGEQKQ